MEGRIIYSSRHEGGSCCVELRNGMGSLSVIVDLHRNVRSINISAMQCLLSDLCIVLAPKFHHAYIATKLRLSTGRCEGTVRAKEIIKLAICKSLRKLLHEAWVS